MNRPLLTLKNMVFGPTFPLIVDTEGALGAVGSFSVI
jgi:hypothetical protein